MKTFRKLVVRALIFAFIVACGYLVQETPAPTALGAALAFGLVN